jgi:hypothetical protein
MDELLEIAEFMKKISLIDAENGSGESVKNCKGRNTS